MVVLLTKLLIVLALDVKLVPLEMFPTTTKQLVNLVMLTKSSMEKEQHVKHVLLEQHQTTTKQPVNPVWPTKLPLLLEFVRTVSMEQWLEMNVLILVSVLKIVDQMENVCSHQRFRFALATACLQEIHALPG
jgi:hypothetical protein